MCCEHPLPTFICATNSSAGTVFADFGRTAVSQFPFFACGRMPQFMSSGTGKTVCCCKVSKIPRLKLIFFPLISGIGKNGNSAVLQNFLCNPRCFVSGIHITNLTSESFSVTWSYTASHATLSLTFPAVISRPIRSHVCRRLYVLRMQTAAHVYLLRTDRSRDRF